MCNIKPKPDIHYKASNMGVRASGPSGHLQPPFRSPSENNQFLGRYFTTGAPGDSGLYELDERITKTKLSLGF